MNETLVQALGFVALGLNLCASSTTNDNRMRAIICLSCLVFAIHYSLLGALVAGLNLFVNSFRALVSVKYKGRHVFFLFLIVQIGMSIYFYSEPRDLLPAIASIISCYALFIAQGMRMRFAFLVCTLTWMVNAVLVGSYGGLINDLFNATMLSITIFRLKKQQKLQVQTS
ncbi:YgjV family protein [Vibrio sinensis]|uniref:YgjV family protein n=1 Tax=Vibrio sinensis TaxID=2302434 RepID=A0A3A6QMU0_9VIBR|nr:YgjV family protein [Vibrio sinensis]RJX69488.1 YgjV family protein [Vibrio sinensis]